MKEIRIYMLHPAVKDVASMLSYLQLNKIGNKYNFIWDNKTPDYLITTEHIYSNKNIRKQFASVHNKAQITIFFTREAVSPDFNLHDYAIGFDSGLKYNDRYIQLPTAFDLYSAFTTEKINKICTIEQAQAELSHKKGFCNFLYSNYLAHPNRDQLYYVLSKYKRVDSLGKHLNNTNQKGTGYKGHEKDCIDIKAPYKFSIACENAAFRGYTSEKIITSLVSHTVPIYFGDPNVTDIINPDCFINCNDFKDLSEVVKIVKEIDENDDLWCKIISAPWQTPSQITQSSLRLNEYRAFWDYIFSQNIQEAKRKATGCRPHMYDSQFFSERIHSKSIIVKIFDKITKSYLKPKSK